MTTSEITATIRRLTGFTIAHSKRITWKYQMTVAREQIGTRKLAFGGSTSEYPSPDEATLAELIAANPPPAKKVRTVSPAAIEAARITRLFKKLTPAIQAACFEDIESECGACEGYGLVFVVRGRHDDGRNVKCRFCGGEGVTWSKFRCVKAVEAAAEHEGSESEKIAAARAECNEREQWDGTLTTTWERNGFVDSVEADRIREKVAYRHEQTDYDSLLASGADRETAREMIR